MPDSWAKAFCPTTALLRATWNPVAPATTRLAEQSCCVRMPVRRPKKSWRVRSAITTSSSEQFPARSPIPLTVHSTCRAPACSAARLLATAMPRSSWQWTLSTTRSMPRTLARRFSMMAAKWEGTAYPTARRGRQRLENGVDVRAVGARERADDGALDLPGNRFHGLEIAWRRDGKSDFHHVHAERGQSL